MQVPVISSGMTDGTVGLYADWLRGGESVDRGRKRNPA